MRYLPDTSVIVDGRFVDFIKKRRGKVEVVISRAVLAEIEHQANQGRAIGFAGLRELRNLREMAEKGKISIEFVGDRPYGEKIRYIDHIVREDAKKSSAVLVTGDRVQYEVAIVEGIESIYLESRKVPVKRIEDFFSPNTMSVHLKEGLPPRGKVGKPGNFRMVNLSDEIMNYEEIVEIANDIVERARAEGFIEIDSKGAAVVQLRDLRIVITRPPFSDAVEITAVKPIVKLSLEDYSLSDKLVERLRERAEGILVAGAPGAGKSTFVQALAEYYASLGKIVKTMEKPRDLQVGEEITQYTSLEGSMERTGDILLLVRPDYTIFDEMRTTNDFKIFTDLRLAGVGMVGVTHATRAIDAVQRFIGRVELGMIPQVIDTIIFIEAGDISEVLTLNYVVKVPTGMMEEDLARPVIEVRDFETGRIVYEIYSFGEQVVVVPVKHEESPVYRLAAERLENIVKKYVKRCKAEILSDRKAVIYVPKREIASVIGKGGRIIDSIERKTGLSIDVRELEEEKTVELGEELPVTVEQKKNVIVLRIPSPSSHVSLYAEDEYIGDVSVSEKGTVRIRRNTEIGKKIVRAMKMGRIIVAKA